MSKHPNEEIVRRFYAAFAAGDVPEFKELMAPDIYWHTPGNSQISGEYKTLDDVLALFAKCGELTAGDLRVDLEGIKVVGDDKVVSTHRVAGSRPDGRKLDIHETENVTIKGDKITRVEESTSDQATSDAFWS
jgi:uncharacterized protein